MIRIKVCDLAPNGACSYYRSLGPLSKLNKLNPEISVEYIENVSMRHLVDTDILFLARPTEDAYLQSLEFAKSFGVKVWIDFDDALHLLPKDNPGYHHFMEPKRLENIEKAIRRAHVVTVSTITIKEMYAKHNPNIIIVENAFNDYNYGFKKRNNDTKYISWRGSNTHRNDLLSCKEEMVFLSKSFPDWEWIFLGGDVWYVTEYIKQAMSMADMEIVNFYRFMYNLQPVIHICPLINTKFNHSKSNIAWIESTWAGATCLAPAIPEFQKPGCVNYTDNFKYLLEKMIKSKSFRRENYEKSFNYIKENLLLSQINKKRLKIVEDLMSI